MTISRKGLDRAIARIIYKLETIRDEGYDRAGSPGWYAPDRLEMIRQIAQLAIDGNELACVGGDRENFGGPPEYFDGEISTSIEPGARVSCRRRRRLEYNRRRGLNQNRTKRVLETREGILETLRRKIAKRSIKSISGRGGTGRRKGLKIRCAC
jgi:hypothetical protein